MIDESVKPVLMIDPSTEGKRLLKSAYPNLQTVMFQHSSMVPLIQDPSQSENLLIIEKVKQGFDANSLCELI